MAGERWLAVRPLFGRTLYADSITNHRRPIPITLDFTSPVQLSLRWFRAFMPQTLLSEIQSWEVASDESWSLIDELEAEQK